jgi:hypothetical protein
LTKHLARATPWVDFLGHEIRERARGCVGARCRVPQSSGSAAQASTAPIGAHRPSDAAASARIFGRLVRRPACLRCEGGRRSRKPRGSQRSGRGLARQQHVGIIRYMRHCLGSHVSECAGEMTARGPILPGHGACPAISARASRSASARGKPPSYSRCAARSSNSTMSSPYARDSRSVTPSQSAETLGFLRRASVTYGTTAPRGVTDGSWSKPAVLLDCDAVTDRGGR